MSRTLYCADLVLAGTELEPLANAAVLVENGVIAAVGNRNDFGAFDGETLHSPVLLPGLVDCHAHMALDAGIHNWPALVPDPPAEHVLRALAAMRADLRSGVTTARYMGDREFIDIPLRRALDRGEIPGPRALIATRGMKASHAHGLVGYPVDGVEERRKFTRENIRAGADWLKLFVTDTVLRPVLHCYPAREEIRVVVEEAHNAGKPVAAHVAGGAGWDVCIEEGVDTLEHGYFVTERQLEALAKADRWLDITPTPILSDYYAERCAPGMAGAFLASRDALRASMRLAVRSGVKYAVGSDGLHGCLADDVAHLVDFGATNREALRAATIQGARLCRVDSVTGSIEKGKSADLIALEANPLDAVAALKSVTMVVRQGKRIHFDAV